MPVINILLTNCGNCPEPYNARLPFCPNCGPMIRKREPNLRSTHFQTARQGKIIKSPRRFGLELEIIMPDANKETRLALYKLPASWGIGYDASIRGDGLGLEVKSPILARAAGEAITKRNCKLLRDAKATVNKSCGLHVHLEAKDFIGNWSKIKKVLAFYLAFNDIIMAMIPHYRRRNRYARNLKMAFPLEKVMDASNSEDLEALWYDEKDAEEREGEKSEYRHNSRYYGINFHGLFSTNSRATNTVEIRYHSPTLNTSKILHWIALHQTILDRAQSLTTNEIWTAASLIFFQDKLNAFMRLLVLEDSLANYVMQRIKLFNRLQFQATSAPIPSTCAA